MADNFLQFSEELTHLTAEEAAWLEGQLQRIAIFGDREYPQDDPTIETPAGDPEYTGPRFLRHNPDFDSSCDVPGFEFSFYDENGTRNLSLYAEAFGDPAYVAWLIHKFLKQFRPGQCWSLTYAVSCSKPRVGEFGGGAVFVTADAIRWQSSDAFIEQELARHKTATIPTEGRA